jgi:hypothetical protein
MITTIIINLLYLVVLLITAPLRALSDVVLNTNIANAITTASSYIGGLSAVIPIGTILGVFGVFLTVEVGILVWKGINWLIRKIPTIN